MEDELYKQIEEWQTKWHHLQEKIKVKIKMKDFSRAYISQCEASILKKCIKDVYTIIQPEEW